MCKLAHIVLKLKGIQMRHIGLLLVIIFCLSAYAADHPVKALGPAVAEVVYKRTKCLDTTKVGIDYRIDLMTLKAGKSASAFILTTEGASTLSAKSNRNMASKSWRTSMLSRG